MNDLNLKIANIIKNLDLSNYKLAYPNFDSEIPHLPSYDTNKWLNTVKSLYHLKQDGKTYQEAVKMVTKGWKETEVFSFLNWLKYYEEGAHMKYKFAQVWYENGQPGYFLHIKPEVKQEPINEDSINEAREEASRQEEHKKLIESQRQKIIGRLDSAEKLLRSPKGKELVGDELESLMDAIYSLKKKIHLVNKKSSATRLYEDMIIREANILTKKGFIKSADIMHSLAQAFTPTPPNDPSGAGHPGLPGTAINNTSLPGTPNINTPSGNDQNADQPPVSALKVPGSLSKAPDSEIASSPPLVPQNAPKEEPKSKGISDFMKNMNEGTQSEEENLEVNDSEDLLVVEAQIAPNPPKEKPIEVTEQDIAKKDLSNFDSKMDQLLSSVSLEDIIQELEGLSKIFKIREIPRRLSLVDMMLNSKGLSSYMDSLAEALNKSLDSSNYISIRIDEMLSKLRGATEGKIINLSGGPTKPASPEIESVRNKLQQDEDKEKERKQLRKEKSDAELGSPNKETPQVDIQEDLAKPPVSPMPTPKPGV